MVCFLLIKWFAFLYSNYSHHDSLQQRNVVCFLPKNGLLFHILMVLIIILYKREMWFAVYPKIGLLIYNVMVLIILLYKERCGFLFTQKWFAFLICNVSHHNSIQKKNVVCFSPKKRFAILHSNGSYHDPI